MPRVCTVCTHPENAAIDEALVARRDSLRDIARRFSGLSKDALHRHRRHLPGRASLPAGGLKAVGRKGPAHSPFTDRKFARAAARAGGFAKANRWRAKKGIAPPPFSGTLLDMMDVAGLTGPTWEPWRSFWRAVYALPMDDTDRERFTRHTGRPAPPTAPVREAWLIVGRRGGKSRMAALAALFSAVRRDWTGVLAPGEIGMVPVIAADRLQARATLGYLKGLLHLPAFQPYVWRNLRESVALLNSTEIRVSTASYRTVRGYTLIGAVLEEVAFWFSETTGANPDAEILSALRPGMATVRDALLLGLSSPYAARGELFKAHQRYTGVDDPRGIAWNADTASMNPAVDPQEIADAFADDPVAAASEYGQGGSVAFRRDVEAFLDAEAIRAVVAAGRRELAPVEGFGYSAFVDTSGGSGDSFTLAIAHREEGRVLLDLVRERRPPFSPDDVVREYTETLGPYGVSFVSGDHYAGEWVRERFTAHGISFEWSERVKSDIYRELLPLVNAGRVELLDLPRLAAQLAGLERRVSRGGKDSIDHLPGAHDDIANATAGALVLAAEGLPSRPHDPADDKPFDPWSREALEHESREKRRIKRDRAPEPGDSEWGVT
jgi:hypothetical protein